MQLIEVQQYIISHFYEQIGITTHDQMKRERLITAEINDNLDLALLNIDDILESVREGIERVNTMFGTDMSVRLNPIIERQRAEAEAAAEEEPEQVPEEEPEEEPEQEPEEEPEQEPEQEAEQEPEEEPEEEPEQVPEEEPEQKSEQEPEEEPEQESEQEPEEEPEQSIEDTTIEINGDNNIIVIGGDPDAVPDDQAGAEEVPDDSGDA